MHETAVHREVRRLEQKTRREPLFIGFVDLPGRWYKTTDKAFIELYKLVGKERFTEVLKSLVEAQPVTE